MGKKVSLIKYKRHGQWESRIKKVFETLEPQKTNDCERYEPLL